MRRTAASVLLFLACASAAAQTTVPEAGDEPGTLSRKVDPDGYSIMSAARGLSTHKASYIYPATYSEDFHGRQTEMVFQFSGKWRVFGTSAYLAYSQKSFWQWINTSQSSPFRETDYNPEAFYRWIPDPKKFNHWALDFGVEHESDGKAYTPPDPLTGQDTNLSRSWNRIYVAPFQAKGKYLFYSKFWYRLPEGEPSSATHQNGDDNPDIVRYLGYGEIDVSRQLGGAQLLSGMVRYNPASGRGAVQATWSIPSSQNWMFWGVSVFHGYGESLLAYDHEVTRVMAGVLLAR